MIEKRKPTHDLAEFKRVCGDPDRLSATRTALNSALSLGFGRNEIAATIRTMERSHFYKSMTSFADRRRWQDVYHVPSPVGVLYVKFTDDVLTEFLLLSFKEKAMNERISPVTGNVLRRDVRPLEVRYKGLSLLIDMPGWYGDDESDAIHSSDDMKISDRALYTLKARAEGLLEPSDIRRIRKKLGLTQKRASEIIGGGPNAFQKYEAGDVVVSRAMSNLLRLLDRQPELLKVIEDAQHRETAA